MATEAANAERQAKAQIAVDTHVERIARSLNVAAPPRTRTDTKDSRNAAETERMATFLELVADAVDPNAAAHKKGQAPQVLGGIGDGYNEQEELAKATKGDGGDEEEPTFRGRKLSEFDGIPDEALTNEEGIGEATAAEIVKARRARDRKANRQ